MNKMLNLLVGKYGTILKQEKENENEYSNR